MERSPAAHLRRPKVDGESRTLRLDRNELSAFMVQAGIGTRREHALASLLALKGLRVSEALNADIDDLGFERGHHTLQIVRKGGKRATVPLAPRTARAVRLSIDGRARTDLRRCPRATHGPPRRRPDRETPRPPSWDQQADQPAQPAQPAAQLLHRHQLFRRRCCPA